MTFICTQEKPPFSTCIRPYVLHEAGTKNAKFKLFWTHICFIIQYFTDPAIYLLHPRYFSHDTTMEKCSFHLLVSALYVNMAPGGDTVVPVRPYASVT